MIALLVALYAVVIAGNLPLFTVCMCLFVGGFTAKAIKTDVLDVFIVALVVIAALVYGLYQIDTHFLSRGHHEAKQPAAAESSEHH